LSVGPQSFTLPASGGLNGTLDDTTGALEGTFVFPVIQSRITDPLPAVVKATLTQQNPAQGSIDPVTGAAELTVTLRIGLEVRTAAGALLVGGSCGIGPVTIAFSGDYDDSSGTLTLADEGFTLPASSGCQGGLDFGPIIDNLLGGDTAASLVLTSSDGPIATTTTTSTTAPSSTAPTTKPTSTSSTAPSGGNGNGNGNGTGNGNGNGNGASPRTAEQPVTMIIVDQEPDQPDLVVNDEQLLTG
jgi:hypothetical protein